MKRAYLLATLAVGISSILLVSADWVAKVTAPASFTSQTAQWSSYVQSPASRNISPVSIHGTYGSVTTNPATASMGCIDPSMVNPLEATLTGKGSYVTYDFGKQVSGFITIRFGDSTTRHARLGVAFSESDKFIGVASDNSTDMAIADGTIYADANPSTSYTFPRGVVRGSYRYLTLSTSTDNDEAIIEILTMSTHFTAAPHTPANGLREYTGFFHSDDVLLNRIWYAGVYTVQLCHIFANESRVNPPAITTTGWFNNATIAGLGADGEAYVDGTKRDRTPWPGDFAASVLPKLVALNRDNLDSVGNSIASLYKLQSKGLFSYAGSPIGERVVAANVNSDTYHLWTMIALAEYTTLSGNTTSMKALWSQTVLGIKTSLDKVDAGDSLMNVTAPYDWGRTGQGGKNIAANVLLYRALIACSQVAAELGLKDATYNGSSWAAIAEKVKSAVNTNLWDASAGLFRDNSTLIEGFADTGELEFPPCGIGMGAYVSHAHAWSAGPVASLTLQLGGLVPVRDAGQVWAFEREPRPDGLHARDWCVLGRVDGRELDQIILQRSRDHAQGHDRFDLRAEFWSHAHVHSNLDQWSRGLCEEHGVELRIRRRQCHGTLRDVRHGAQRRRRVRHRGQADLSRVVNEFRKA